MIHRILLAVDDSPDSLAATRVAVEIAHHLHARLRAVHVRSDHGFEAAIETASGDAVEFRRSRAETSLLARVASLAEARGVAVETVLLGGSIGAVLLDAARDWGAELVVIGKSGRLVIGEPYVGSLTRHVLEFADQPVLVVPATAPRH